MQTFLPYPSFYHSLACLDYERLGKQIQSWLDTHAGDFSEIVDFRASLANHEIPWKEEESEYIFTAGFWAYESELTPIDQPNPIIQEGRFR